MLDLRKAINTYIKSNISFSIILSPQNRILCNYIPCCWNIHIDKVLTKVRGHTRSEVEIRPCGGRYITIIHYITHHKVSRSISETLS